MQLEFLKNRLRNEIECNKVSTKVLLLDRCIYEDYHIFTKAQKELGIINMSEFNEYKNVYTQNLDKARAPNLFIYLRTSPNELLRRIKLRGRDYEQSIDIKYLSTLDKYYNLFFNKVRDKFTESKFITVETDGLNVEEVYERVRTHIPQ